MPILRRPPDAVDGNGATATADRRLAVPADLRQQLLAEPAGEGCRAGVAEPSAAADLLAATA